MKKLLLGLGTVISAAAPVAAVVACGDKEEAKVNGMVHEFSPIGKAASIGANLNEDTSYSRFRSIAMQNTPALAEILKITGKTDVAALSIDTTMLDDLEGHLREYLRDNAALYPVVGKGEADMHAAGSHDSHIVLGTFGADAPGATGDTFIQLGVNGFATKEKAVAFLKAALTNNDAKHPVEAEDKKILAVLMNGL